MSQVSLNIAQLASLLRSQVPGCTGAVLVGSAVTRSADCVADIDVTAFDASVELGTDSSSSFVYQRLPVHVVAYNPWHFRAVAESDLLTFAYIREIRKLLRGVVLFDDDGTVELSLRRISRCAVAPQLLAPLVATAGTAFELPETAAGSRLSFYRAVEGLTFAWLHVRPEYTYSKPKWLLEDAKSTRSPALGRLLHSISDELVGEHDVGQLVERVSGQLPGECGGAERQCLNNLADARSLLKFGQIRAAVFPLRMMIYQACELWANYLDYPYTDLRDIEGLSSELERVAPQMAAAAHDSLLLGEPVPHVLHRLWKLAYDKFLEDWQSVASPVDGRSGIFVS